MSYLLTQDQAAIAAQVGFAAFEKMRDEGLSAKDKLAVVIMNPAILPPPLLGETYDPEFDQVFYQAILYRTTHGNVSQSECVEIARRKARASWRTGQSMRQLLTSNPGALIWDDPRWVGSDVLGDFITAASGAEGRIDETVSRIINAVCFLIAIGRLEEQVLSTEAHFLGLEHST